MAYFSFAFWLEIFNDIKDRGVKEILYIISDFKKIYTSNDKNIANLYWNEFKEKYKDNKLVIKYATRYIDEITPLFDVPNTNST